MNEEENSPVLLRARLVAFVAVVLVSPLCHAQSPHGTPHGATPEFLRIKASFVDPAEGWESLFNGKDLSRWKPLRDAQKPPKPYDWALPRLVRLDASDPRRLEALPYPPSGNHGEPPAPAFVNNRQGRSDSLITAANYRDVELYVEFMVAQRSNSGVCLMGLYEIQIYDSFGKTALKYGDNGGIYARLVDEQRVGGEPPRVNVSRPPGEWQSFHIWFRAPRFDGAGNRVENARFLRVEHNGTLIHENYELEGSTRAMSPWAERPEAPLLLQGDHGPVAFRNIYIRPLREGR